MRPFAPLAAALMLAAPAAAQTDQQTAAPPDRHTLSLAAGYKAAFLCSGMFNGGLDQETVAADDLTRIEFPAAQPVSALRDGRDLVLRFGRAAPSDLSRLTVSPLPTCAPYRMLAVRGAVTRGSQA